MRPSAPSTNGMLAFSASLSTYFAAKEASEVARIHAMLGFFASDQCLSQRLAAYFGDTRAPLYCGHCSVCQGQVAHLPPPVPLPLPPLEQHSFAAPCGRLLQHHRLHHDAPLTAEALTRHLCGITVPILTHLKARSLGGFAALEHHPYAELRRWVQQSA